MLIPVPGSKFKVTEIRSGEVYSIIQVLPMYNMRYKLYKFISQLNIYIITLFTILWGSQFTFKQFLVHFSKLFKWLSIFTLNVNDVWPNYFLSHFSGWCVTHFWPHLNSSFAVPNIPRLVKACRPFTQVLFLERLYSLFRLFRFSWIICFQSNQVRIRNGISQGMVSSWKVISL